MKLHALVQAELNEKEQIPHRPYSAMSYEGFVCDEDGGKKCFSVGTFASEQAAKRECRDLSHNKHPYKVVDHEAKTTKWFDKDGVVTKRT